MHSGPPPLRVRGGAFPFTSHNASKERCLYRPSTGGYTTSRRGPKMLKSLRLSGKFSLDHSEFASVE